MSAAEGQGGGGVGRPPRLCTIAPDKPFLDTLAGAILGGDLPVEGGQPPDPLGLPRWTILLPTRRAARELARAFLRVSGGRAMLLPRIRPLGDADEDALALAAPPEAGGGSLALDLSPAIGQMERRLALTKLIRKWSEQTSGGSDEEGFRAPATPAQASSLAAELAALMDTFDVERTDLGGLADLVPEERFAEHWQLTVEFLEIVTEHWPRHLEENGVMAPYARRDALMAEEAERLRATPPDAPVIAAGSTATVPATAELLETVARLENGAVVLPGLDLHLDETSWDGIAGERRHPEHPQFGMHRFLARLGVTRGEVRTLGESGAAEARTMLVSEAMRPAGRTEQWSALAETADRDAMIRALEGVSLIEAPTGQDEAEAISLLLRHAVETPGRTAALVTPDRTLARRVSARLEKWGLKVDDSAGTPLARTPPGSFMDALAEAAESGFAPVPLLALLKHPLVLLGREPGDMRRAARLLELAAFRQPATGKSMKAHCDAVERSRARVEKDRHAPPVLKRFGPRDWDTVGRLLDDLDTALAPLAELFAAPDRPRALADLVRAHVEAGEALAKGTGGSGAGLWRGDAGEALAELFASLVAGDDTDLEVAPDAYTELYRSFLAGLAVRPRAPTHPRIHIWGPLEARLQRPDMIVLGGLNEGVWPASAETGPWLSRPMRERLGLPSPERAIGLSAHDVAQLLGVSEVWLTRSQKSEGTPTVPSRWLLRLQAVLDALGLEGGLNPADPWLQWARARDRVDTVSPVSAPAPCPPVHARPKRLSVTRVETWMANPYAIFAGDILRLRKLDDLAGEPDAALKGTLVHDALQRFAEAHPERLPNDIAAELMRHARALFAQFGDSARIETFWRGQLALFARWFAATEPGRRAGVSKVLAEIKGELLLGGADGFTLSAEADRIDLRDDGTLALYDYKTGAPPTAARVEKAMAPQLSLEAAIAAAGGFEGVDKAHVSRLAYIRARGYGEGGDERDACAKVAPEALAAEALEHLARLVAAYAGETQAYAALRRPGFDYRFDDYAHLARVAEWQAGEGAEE